MSLLINRICLPWVMALAFRIWLLPHHIISSHDHANLLAFPPQDPAQGPLPRSSAGVTLKQRRTKRRWYAAFLRGEVAAS